MYNIYLLRYRFKHKKNDTKLKYKKKLEYKTKNTKKLLT